MWMLPKTIKYAKLIFSVLCLLCTAFVVCEASMESSLEENIKSAYLFNFAKFVEWPSRAFSSKDAPLNICVLGDDSLTKGLKLLENKNVAGRKLVVHQVNNWKDAHDCHIVYIGESEKKVLGNVLSHFHHKPVLTVSSISDFAGQGGMIGFVRKGNLVRFEVNRKAVMDSELTISSRLLKLALIVEGDKGGI